MTPLTEEQFARQVIDLATMLGWRVFRVENSTREITRRSGARVRVRNINFGGVGFPDLVLVRADTDRLIFAELKTDIGRVRPEQETWLADLESVADAIDSLSVGDDLPLSFTKPRIGVYIWRPRDFSSIERILRVDE